MKRKVIHLVVLFIATAMLASAVGGFVSSPGARASELVDRKTKKETLRVNNKGTAMVYFTARGKKFHIAYWGSVNADMNKTSTLRFKHDRSGGWISGKGHWQTFKNTCGKYTGPVLPYVVAQCTAKDGSHWVLQKWARTAANYGANVARSATELRISHFTLAPAVLDVRPNWSWSGRFMHIVATFSYNGKPWYAVKFKENGYVTDMIGRNVTIDAYNSDMGSGWRRVNAILTHRPSGQMCFGFTPKTLPDGSRSGSGYSATNQYRLAVPGPGVSPDIEKKFSGVLLQNYDPALDQPVNDYIRSLIVGWSGTHNCNSIN